MAKAGKVRAAAATPPVQSTTPVKPSAKLAEKTGLPPGTPILAPAGDATGPDAAAGAKGGRKARGAGDKDKPGKAKKPKLVRDSFSMPKADYAVLEALKARSARAGAPAKKSQLVRAGIRALAALGDVDFLAALQSAPALKTGRPASAP